MVALELENLHDQSRTDRGFYMKASGRRSGDRPRLVTVADEMDQARYVAARVLENREGGSVQRE
jgi:hypothetical protein